MEITLNPPKFVLINGMAWHHGSLLGGKHLEELVRWEEKDGKTVRQPHRGALTCVYVDARRLRRVYIYARECLYAAGAQGSNNL